MMQISMQTLKEEVADLAYSKLTPRDVPWYTDDVESQLLPEIRKQFQEYSGIAPNKVIPHILNVREKLWNTRAYPCAGLFFFLVPLIKYHSDYHAILQKSKDPNAKVLDVGCYVSHDLRALHLDGVPQSSLHALDLTDYSELGAELFNDADKFSLNGRFTVGDILDFSKESEASRLCDGKIDVVWCALVIHLFTWDQQVMACKRLIRYSKGPGSIIVGCQVGKQEITGNLALHNVTDGKYKGTEPFGHSIESLKKLWSVAGEEAGVKLGLDIGWRTYRSFGLQHEKSMFLGLDMGVLEFTVLLL